MSGESEHRAEQSNRHNRAQRTAGNKKKKKKLYP
jgi:hypothetical protein